MLRSLAQRTRFLLRDLYDRISPPSKWNGTPHPVFANFPGWSGNADGQFGYDFLGGKTDPKFRASYKTQSGPVTPEPPIPSVQYVEWTFQFQRVLAHQNESRPFVYAEIGAGYGHWMAIINNAFRQLGRDDTKLIGIELDPMRHLWMREHMENNGIDDTRATCIWGGVAETDGETRIAFDATPDSSYGAGLHSAGVGPEQTVPLISLPTLLKDYEIIDLVHVDVQGAELDAIPAARNFLKERVRSLFIATHSASIHRQLHRLLQEDGWNIEESYRPGRRGSTPHGDHWFLDGVLTARSNNVA